jgi:hypothetical protein
MKVFIDDIRPAPEGWLQARTVTDAIKTIARFNTEITDISIDHDISYAVTVAGETRPFPSPETFQAVAYYIAAVCLPEVNITIHSANPVGCLELQAIFNDYNFKSTITPASRVNRLESEV